MAERASQGDRQVIAIGMVWQGDQLLVGRRTPEMDLGNFDEFPGGKCRRDEHPSVAVVRECREETGLRVVVLGQRMVVEHDYPHGRLRLHFFDCRLAAEQPDVTPRAPFVWRSVEETLALCFPPANQAVLISLRQSPRPLSGD